MNVEELQNYIKNISSDDYEKEISFFEMGIDDSEDFINKAKGLDFSVLNAYWGICACTVLAGYLALEYRQDILNINDYKKIFDSTCLSLKNKDGESDDNIKQCMNGLYPHEIIIGDKLQKSYVDIYPELDFRSTY
jgi:hypothetical protein